MLSWITETCNRLVAGALMPAYDFFADPTSRYFWLYCATGLLIAAYTYHRHREAKGFRETLLDREVWTSPSAINDYIILVITPMMRLTILSWAAINWVHVKNFVVSTLTAFGVSGTVNDSTAVTIGIALTITLFLVDDFLRWLVHYTFHRVPELWEFHKVHHSAEVLNFATAERHHPVEVLITAAVLTTAYGLVNGIFIALFGDKVTVDDHRRRQHLPVRIQHCRRRAASLAVLDQLWTARGALGDLAGDAPDPPLGEARALRSQHGRLPGHLGPHVRHLARAARPRDRGLRDW